MNPIPFKESNQIFEGDGNHIADIDAWQGTVDNKYNVIITCWQPSPEELAEIARTGQVWLYTYGLDLPPHSIGCFNPFKTPSDLTKN